MNRYTLHKQFPLLTKTAMRVKHFLNSVKYNIVYGKQHAYYDYQLTRPLGPQKSLCYAPQKSLYFGIGGNVTACCLNRSVGFGKIPDNTIDEILENTKRERLQQKLSRNKLDYGCFHCKERINAGNFDTVEALLYDTLPANNKKPSYFIFELDNNCNLNCIMCNTTFSSSSTTEEGMTLKASDIYKSSFVQQLEAYIPFLYKTKFMGGEPFLIKIYYDIWENIIKLNPDCLIDIQTNGTVLNEKIVSLLEKGNFRISLSIDSFKKSTYETIRQNASYEDVMQNLDYFTAHARKNKYPMTISVCPMQQNMHEIPDIIQFCNKNDFYVYFNTVWKPAHCSLRFLEPDELLQLINFYKSIELPSYSDYEIKNKLHYTGFINQLVSWETEIRKEKSFILQWRDTLKQIKEISTDDIVMQVSEKLSVNVDAKTKEANTKKIKQVVDMFHNDDVLKIALYNLLNYPTELLSDELQSNTPEQLYKLALEVVKYTENELKNIEPFLDKK